MDADGKHDLAAQRSSQAHFSAPTHGRALRLPRLWHLRLNVRAFVVVGNRGVPGSCFRMLSMRRGWDGGMERGARVPVPAANKQGQQVPLTIVSQGGNID